jgi:hypothetical protein
LGGLAFEVEQGVIPFSWSERALARVSTVRYDAGDRHASFLADFLGNCAIPFPICPLMLQKCAFRYFRPEMSVLALRDGQSSRHWHSRACASGRGLGDDDGGAFASLGSTQSPSMFRWNIFIRSACAIRFLGHIDLVKTRGNNRFTE